MIASNYIRHPDALRFQRELFHNGYKNQPRLMRLMECIFSVTPTTPQWLKEADMRARALAREWKAAQRTLSFTRPIREWIASMQMGLEYIAHF